METQRGGCLNPSRTSCKALAGNYIGRQEEKHCKKDGMEKCVCVCFFNNRFSSSGLSDCKILNSPFFCFRKKIRKFIKTVINAGVKLSFRNFYLYFSSSFSKLSSLSFKLLQFFLTYIIVFVLYCYLIP